MWRKSILGVLVLISATASAAPSSPKPIGSPKSWITADDYPRDALRKVVGGSVNFTLQVSADGKVTDCIITESSGNQSLDDATCALMIARARFQPAQDENSQAIAGTYHSRVNWAIPDNGPIPLPTTQSIVQKVTFNVNASGKFSSCVVDGEVPSWIGLIEQICDRLPSMNILFAPEPSGRMRHVAITVHFDVAGSKP